MTDAVKITGLREFQRSLKAMDDDLPKALRMAFNDAADIVADDARGHIPNRTNKAKRSVKVASTQTAARIRGGGNKAPYYPWLDFGGRVGRNRSVRRPYLPRGRYIYNAYFRHRDAGDFQDALSEGLVKVAKSAGLEVTHGE